MLRVGLTGNLGSGKSTVARMFERLGARVLASDAIGRELMQPGQAVFERIVAHFGRDVLGADGTLDRGVLARIAFAEGRAEELNAIVHPAVIARQGELAAALFASEPAAVLMVESALIFETKYVPNAGGEDEWHWRFDRIVLVTAPEEEKIARFVRRQNPNAYPSPVEVQAAEAEARRRLALQIPDAVKAPRCDFVVVNDGSMAQLEGQVEILWPVLTAAAGGA